MIYNKTLINNIYKSHTGLKSHCLSENSTPQVEKGMTFYSKKPALHDLVWQILASVAQGLEHWSCKPGVESSNLSGGYLENPLPGWVLCTWPRC